MKSFGPKNCQIPCKDQKLERPHFFKVQSGKITVCYLLFDADLTFSSPPNFKLNNPRNINIEALTLDHGQHVEKKGKRKSKK